MLIAVLVVIAVELLIALELLRQIKWMGTGTGYTPLVEIVKGWFGR